MQQQKLCLKWNNHTINLLSVLENFQSKDILVDVTLSCEGRNIKAHKMVLSACSPYFQNIFLENPCQHPIVIINGMKFEDITAILNFMYKGEVNVSHEGLSSFLQAAEALKVKGLAEVCGEKRGSNSNCQEAEPSEPARPQRTDTPTKKRHRNRKRSFSDSNRSDDEGAPRKHKEINSPEVHELSGDESYTGDMSSNGQPLNSRVPQNVYSRSHQSSSNITADDMEDEYEVEPSKMLEQTLTENANNSTSSDNGLRIERIVGNAPEMESSSLQEPESPPDIKPIIEFGETSAGPSEGSMLVYNEQSQPGPSNIQDPSLLHDNSHTQGNKIDELLKLIDDDEINRRKRLIVKKLEKLKMNEKISRYEWQKQATNMLEELKQTLNEHTLLLGSKMHTMAFMENSVIALDSMPNLPVDSTKDLEKWETFLGDTNSFELVVKYFGSQINLDVRKSTRRILYAIITNKFARELDWSGEESKINFKELKTVSLILNCFKKFPSTTNVPPSIIGHYIRDWLKEAGFQEQVLNKLNLLTNNIHTDAANEVKNMPDALVLPKYEYMQKFPITSIEKMEELEKFLSEEGNLMTMAVTLRRIGGSDEYQVVTKLLKRILTNGVAECYSWCGMKGKKEFRELKLAKLVLETVRLHFPLITEEPVSSIITNWLKYAKQRRARKEGRK